MRNPSSPSFVHLTLSFALLCAAGMGYGENVSEETELVSVDAIPAAFPEYLHAYRDPAYGRKVTRITDAKTFGYPNPRHGYSKNQPWNCDGRFIRIRDRLLDGSTYQLIRTVPHLDEAKWAHTDPVAIYGFPDRTSFARLCLTNDSITVLRRFPEHDEVRMGPWEGNLSADDRYVVFSARKDQDLTVIVCDIAANTVVATQHFPGRWKSLDWVSVSPSGQYVLFNWVPGDRTTGKVIDCYSRELVFLRRLSDQGCHGDMGYDAEGVELYVQFEFGDARGIWAYSLSDGGRRRLLPDKYNGGHLSCRNSRQPGWCYLSCNKEGFQEVFALKLDGSGLVRRIAQHHSSAASYEAEVQAVPNPDGTKVMFASDWNGQQDINSFVAE